MTGIVTASWMPRIMSGSDMRATPPSRRMSAGTRSSAITAHAPASSAIFACPGLFRDLRLLGVDHVHDHAALQHLGQAALHPHRPDLAHSGNASYRERN